MKIKEIINKFNYKQRRIIVGISFISPFIIGFVLFFLYPLIHSILFSFSELKIHSQGFDLNFVGPDNYYHALFIDIEFIRTLTETFLQMINDLPLILAFSFFAAILLNQSFRGRMLVRTIFFLPVILGSGIVLRLEQQSLLMRSLQSGAGEGILGATQIIQTLIYQFKLPEDFLSYIITGVEQIPQIIRSSAIQILIFLAGLHSIPDSLYEASKIEGATAWENFWKITFPLMTPLILANIIYTIIDSFTSPFNETVELISNTAFGGAGFGISSAMCWIYFIIILILIIIVFKIVSRGTFYYD